MTGIVWGGTWRLRATYIDYSYFCALVGVRIYTCPYMCTQLKIHDIKSLVFLVPEVSLAQFYFLFDGPGMSFVEGIVGPQASQTCCDRKWSNLVLLLVFLMGWIAKKDVKNFFFGLISENWWIYGSSSDWMFCNWCLNILFCRLHLNFSNLSAAVVSCRNCFDWLISSPMYILFPSCPFSPSSSVSLFL